MLKALSENKCLKCSCFYCIEKECIRVKWCNLMKCENPKCCFRLDSPPIVPFKEKYKRFKQGVKDHEQR